LQLTKVKAQIQALEAGEEGLTPLGRQLLFSREEAEKQKIQLAELNSQLNLPAGRRVKSMLKLRS
jgi:hypothetical protein